jgi:uncharacterized iron-regulated membrane protein
MSNPRIWNRKLHRWGAVGVALPFLLVLVTGILLQVKKQVPWVQPIEVRGEGKVPIVDFDSLLAVARSVPQAGIASWADVDRVDVRPSKGFAKIIGNTRWELQVDLASGRVLHSAYRRSDLIESLHDGSWFHDAAKLWIFLPVAIVVLGLWVTGMYLWAIPYLARRQNDRRRGGERRAAA